MALLFRVLLRALYGVLLLGLAAAMPARAGNDNLSFEHLLTNDADLRDNIGAVNAIKQDQQGFMWFAGENGVARYDGHNLVFYHEGRLGSGQLCGNFVWDLAVDKSGELWLATQKGLNRYDRAGDRFESFVHDAQNPNSLGEDYIRSLAFDATGLLWLGTQNGLDVMDPVRGTFRHYRHDPADTQSLSSNSIRRIKIDSQNRLWIGTADAGLMRVDQLPKPGEALQGVRYLADVNNPTALNTSKINALEEDAEGRLWVGTYGGGLHRLSADLKEFTRLPIRAGKKNMLIAQVVESIT